MIWLPTAILALAATSGEAVLLDFHADGCLPCQQMSPTLDQMSLQGYPVRKVNASRDPATAARYGVRAFPTFILVSNGREVDRVVGATSYDRLVQMFRKASLLDANAEPPAGTKQMPATMPSSSGNSLPAVAGGPLGQGRLPAATPEDTPDAAEPRKTGPIRAGLAELIGTVAGSGSRWSPVSTASADRGQRIAQNPNLAQPVSFAAAATEPADAATTPVANAQLIASTVRLRIEDPSGHSCGTGTIIDSRDGWALILTCGHLFRDSKGKGRIDVDLFGPDGQRRVQGDIVAYDSEKLDLGLLRIRVDGPVRVAPVAPPGYQVEVGSPVASVGCSNGADPTVVRTRIRAKNKFVGPPNLQADGLPVEGRSGGGLFSEEGYVVGVCNAADPTDNAGLYRALEAIQAELDRTNLTYVYQRPAGRPADRWNPASVAPPAELVAVTAPEMPVEMPAPSALAEATAGSTVPTSSRHTIPAAGPSNLSPEEAAALEEIRRRQAQGAEVICIIRAPNDPTGKSEILRLDKASPAFLEALAREAAGQASAPPASY
ncbi:MAG TPA: hypothetical protein DD670_21125 [Planctomycetaceae bacterium]|nr:hypothetical protein [Planctomycetaceae bacterium]